MFERILVPLDGSILSEISLPYAEEIGQKLGGEVTLLFISDKHDDPYRHVIEPYLKDKAEDLKKKVGAERVNATILTGHPAEEITDYADKNDVSLVIMSSHGHTGYAHCDLGGMADKVVRAARRPLALIKARPEAQQTGVFNRIMVTLDGSETGETVLPYAREFATKLNSELTLLHVLQPSYDTFTSEMVKMLDAQRESAQKYLERIAANLKKEGITARTMFDETPRAVAEAIIKNVEKSKVDLLMMATRGYSGITRWALGSTAEKLMHGGNTPLILVPVNK